MTHSRTLGLGLKFRPTRQPPAARVFDNQIYDLLLLLLLLFYLGTTLILLT